MDEVEFRAKMVSLLQTRSLCDAAHAIGCSLVTVRRYVDGTGAPHPKLFEAAIELVSEVKPRVCPTTGHGPLGVK